VCLETIQKQVSLNGEPIPARKRLMPLHQITRAMALDHVKDGIRINAVCPGEVNTPMIPSERSEPVTPELMARLAETLPSGVWRTQWRLRE